MEFDNDTEEIKKNNDIEEINYESLEDVYISSDAVNRAIRRENQREINSFNPFDMPVTYILLIANVISFIVCLRSDTDVFLSGGVNIDYVLVNREYQRLISYMFLHAGIAHLGCNMFSLILFGQELEKKVGSVYMLIIYVISGIAGGLCSMYMNSFIKPDAMVFCVGASGALFGVMSGTVVMRYRSRKSSKLSGLIMSIAYILLYAILNISSGVDFWAHLGGGIGGVAIAFIISLGRWEDYNEKAFRKIAGSILAVIFCIFAIGSIGIGKELSALPDERVDFIKEQPVPNHGDRKIGEYFDEKFKEEKWTGFTSDDNREVVQFEGEIFYQMHIRKVIMQFVLFDNNTSYEIWYVGVEDLEVTNITMSEFLEYLFE